MQKCMKVSQKKAKFMSFAGWKIDFWKYKDFTRQSQYGWHTFMPEPCIKYAGPRRSERRGPTLNSDQEPNHWKTPTGFQCGLPGQHEQELSTMAAELQKTKRRAHNNKGRGVGGRGICLQDRTGETMNACWVHFSTRTKQRKFGERLGCSSRW